jgi:preprotein translocase subunit SecA
MDIYKLGVVEIPTNVPVARKDDDDEVYRTAREKYARDRARSRNARARASRCWSAPRRSRSRKMLSDLRC